MFSAMARVIRPIGLACQRWASRGRVLFLGPDSDREWVRLTGLPARTDFERQVAEAITELGKDGVARRGRLIETLAGQRFYDQLGPWGMTTEGGAFALLALEADVRRELAQLDGGFLRPTADPDAAVNSPAERKEVNTMMRAKGQRKPWYRPWFPCLVALVIARGLACGELKAAPLAVQLLQAIPDAPAQSQARGVVYRALVPFPARGIACVARLAGDAAGQAGFFVDDRLTLIAHGEGTAAQPITLDFRDLHGHIRPLVPLDLPQLGGDSALIEVIVEDLEPPTWGASDLWLIPCANLAPPSQQQEIGPESTVVPHPTPSITPPPATPPPAPGAVATAVRSTPSPQPALTRTPTPADEVPGTPSDVLTGRTTALRETHHWQLLAAAVAALVVSLYFLRRRRRKFGAHTDHLLVTLEDLAAPAPPVLVRVAHSALPVGIALDPLRLVAPDDPSAVAQLAVDRRGRLTLLCQADVAESLRVSIGALPLVPSEEGHDDSPAVFASLVDAI